MPSWETRPPSGTHTTTSAHTTHAHANNGTQHIKPEIHPSANTADTHTRVFANVSAQRAFGVSRVE